jgi:hypothetical protein
MRQIKYDEFENFASFALFLLPVLSAPMQFRGFRNLNYAAQKEQLHDEKAKFSPRNGSKTVPCLPTLGMIGHCY